MKNLDLWKKYFFINHLNTIVNLSGKRLPKEKLDENLIHSCKQTNPLPPERIFSPPHKGENQMKKLTREAVELLEKYEKTHPKAQSSVVFFAAIMWLIGCTAGPTMPEYRKLEARVDSLTILQERIDSLAQVIDTLSLVEGPEGPKGDSGEAGKNAGQIHIKIGILSISIYNSTLESWEFNWNSPTTTDQWAYSFYIRPRDGDNWMTYGSANKIFWGTNGVWFLDSSMFYSGWQFKVVLIEPN